MRNNFRFEPIDTEKWERAQHFYHFTEMANIGFSINAEIDVTRLRYALKVNGLKFYPAYLWIITTVLNRHKELKTTIYNDQVGYWSSLTPIYSIFHDDNKTFSLLWTEYSDDFTVFYQNYRDDVEKYGKIHGILAKPDPLPNCYTISSIPWIPFTGFALHKYTAKPGYLPFVEAGKFIKRKKQNIMPISITAHHAVCDGYHISLFLDDLQRICNETNSWIG